MKIYSLLIVILIMGLCSACNQYQEIDPSESEFKLVISVEPMIGVEEETTSRAFSSMTVDRENIIKSIAIFQFNKEGYLRSLYTQNDKPIRYLYQKFTDPGDPNGVSIVVDAKVDKIESLKSIEPMHTCLIANINEADLYNILFPRGEEDPIDWNEFQEVEIELPFVFKKPDEMTQDPSLELDHLYGNYMFGYYYGQVPPEGFTISLGRIMCHLKVNLHVDGFTSDMKVYAAIHNLETHAYFSVAKDSPHLHYSYPAPQLLDDPRFDLTTGSGVLHYYSAPHVSDKNIITEETTTCLYLWCVKGDYVPKIEDTDYAAKIPLGANPAQNQYHLSRNTLYSFRVNLSLKEVSPPVNP